ncbi:MAG: SsrA-binding protein SmpB [Clostridia bacterium]|nr:SsrA-binding protein SmpB [Clostridia bacterium]
MQKNEGTKTLASNRKAFHDYFVEERFEAGIELFGTEVKSIRAGTVNLKDSYLNIRDGELFAKGIHISPYEKGNIFNRDPLRERKLLMHKKEILKLRALAERDGYTLIPLSLYLKRGRVKVEVGVCRGKKLYDKRESTLKRDLERENRRGIKLADRD